MSNIRIVLADDHTLVRAGLRTLLETIENVAVVAEAGNGREALELTRKHCPDLVVMDIGMSEMDGLQATAAIKSEMPEVKTIILSMHNTGDIVEEALRVGASAYLVKDAAIAELELAVKAVSRGDVFLSPSVSRHVVAGYVKGASDPARGDGLTPRQHEILTLIGEGKNTKSIARLLDLSVKTVEAHKAQIMERLGVRDATNLILEAIRRGLIRVK